MKITRGRFNLLNHKKQAQHLVELAIVLPIFVLIFCIALQMVGDNFAGHNFSYIFSNIVRAEIETQEVATTLDDKLGYDFRTRVFDRLNDRFDLKINNFSDISVGLIDTLGQTQYITSAFTHQATVPFLNRISDMYFYTFVPINRAYSEIPFLPFTDDMVQTFYNNYVTGNMTSSPLPDDGLEGEPETTPDVEPEIGGE